MSCSGDEIVITSFPLSWETSTLTHVTRSVSTYLVELITPSLSGDPRELA